MFLEDLRRTFRAWVTQPLLPAVVVAFGLLGAAAEYVVSPLLLLLFPACFFWIGFMGTQRVWYARAFEGRGLRPGEAYELSLAFFGRYFALGAAALLVWLPVGMTLGALGLSRSVAIAGSTIVVDVLFTFTTSAATVGDEGTSRAIATGWKMLRSGFPRCLPHAFLPPLALYGLSEGRGWLFLAAEVLALVARGVTTSYYLRNTVAVEPPRVYGEQRDPAYYG